jgi:hypothetical protein
MGGRQWTIRCCEAGCVEFGAAACLFDDDTINVQGAVVRLRIFRHHMALRFASRFARVPTRRFLFLVQTTAS